MFYQICLASGFWGSSTIAKLLLGKKKDTSDQPLQAYDKEKIEQMHSNLETIFQVRYILLHSSLKSFTARFQDLATSSHILPCRCNVLGDRHSPFRTLTLISTPIRRSLRAYAILLMHAFSLLRSSFTARLQCRCNGWFNQFYKAPWACFARGACTYVVQIYPQKSQGCSRQGSAKTRRLVS